MTASARARVTRAQLVGAYSRRQGLVYRGQPTAEVDARIAELEAILPAELIADARRIATPGQPMILGDGAGGHHRPEP